NITPLHVRHIRAPGVVNVSKIELLCGREFLIDSEEILPPGRQRRHRCIVAGPDGGVASCARVWERDEIGIEDGRGPRVHGYEIPLKGLERPRARWLARTVGIFRASEQGCSPWIYIGGSGCDRRTDIAEVGEPRGTRWNLVAGRIQAEWAGVRAIPAISLRQRWNRLVELDRVFIMAVFLGNEEKCLVFIYVVVARNINRAAERAAGLIFLIERRTLCLVKEVPGIKMVVPCKEITIAMKGRSPGLCRSQNRAGGAASILCPVV